MSNESLSKAEDQPNKGFSFIVGIFIAMAMQTKSHSKRLSEILPELIALFDPDGLLVAS